MRLYGKLALMVLLACAGQVAMASGIAAETYFTLRCCAAMSSGDAVAEAQLVQEWQAKLRHRRNQSVKVFTSKAAAAPG